MALDTMAPSSSFRQRAATSSSRLAPLLDPPTVGPGDLHITKLGKELNLLMPAVRRQPARDGEGRGGRYREE